MKRALLPVIALSLMLASCGTGNDEEAQKLCEQDTISKSKYPAAAEVTIDGTEIIKEEDKIVVSGYGDFVNGFGAPVRHTFFCAVSTSGSELEIIDNIVMEGGWLESDLEE